MGFSKVKIGNLIDSINRKSNINNLTVFDVFGINRDKEFFSPAIQVGQDTSNYKIVPPDCFACNLMHVGRDTVIPISLNRTSEDIIVSPAYFVFYVVRKDLILQEYLYMVFKKIDFDRYAAFCTDSSVRDGLEVNRFLDIEVELPSIDVQQRVVDVYMAIVENQMTLESSIDDLKLTCDAYIENMKKKNILFSLDDFLEPVSEQNLDSKFMVQHVVGVSAKKEIIPTKADSSDNDLTKFIVIEKNDFVYNPRSANAIAIYLYELGSIISWNNTAFRVKKELQSTLLPKYLSLWFSRDEYSRWAKFNSWGSSTELLNLNEIRSYKIPIPDIKSQEAIINVFETYNSRKDIASKLRNIVNEVCPVLIKGSLLHTI